MKPVEDMRAALCTMIAIASGIGLALGIIIAKKTDRKILPSRRICRPARPADAHVKLHNNCPYRKIPCVKRRLSALFY